MLKELKKHSHSYKYLYNKDKRDKCYFHFQLKRTCILWKKYNDYKHKKKINTILLKDKLPIEIIYLINDFYPFIVEYKYPYFNEKKFNFRWYILISNILHTIDEKYHNKVLDIHKKLNHNMYFLDFNSFMLYFSKLNILYTNVLFPNDTKENDIFAYRYKHYLNNIIYYMNLHMIGS